MQNIIVILEVSRKQDYIFRSKRLKENAKHSAEIAYVTGNDFFEAVTEAELYSKERNYIYSGGGHTVLQFNSKEKAKEFVKKVTESAMRLFDGLEIFAKLMPYDENRTPGDNLKQLSKLLEQKKSRRKETFRYTALGIEELDTENYMPVTKMELNVQKNKMTDSTVKSPDGWQFPQDFNELVYKTYDKDQDIQNDNFLAVVHIDGNAMGAKVDAIYQKETQSWQKCCESLQEFSETIQQDFENAFKEMVQEVINQNLSSDILPVRPVILAGDDVCFVSAGSIGLECARIFLEKLSKKQINGENYAACAGVAIVHRKYPFHLAYELAEELCSSAKKMGAGLDEKSRVSAIDCHIEFGQLKDNLEEIRKDYMTEDGNRLELRPLVVVKPEECEVDSVREYDFFKTMCTVLQKKRGEIARSKIKEWRNALKQGEVETEFFIHDKQISDMLYAGFSAEYRTDEEKAEQYMRILNKEKSLEKEPFRLCNGTKRSLFFDAIEMMDHEIFFDRKEQ